jgi:hypothetical protein|tara:strand:- start:135 stop:395 length:261 start_codon:yes stop_codon:yes gene_type:complete
MSASSISRQVAEVEKSKKVERRHALEARKVPEVDKQQREQANVGGVSPETGSSDSVVESGKIEVKPVTKKAPAKKASTKKKSAKKS